MPYATAPTSAVIEDIEWMLDSRECLAMAAQRLHMKPDSLERRLERAGRCDLVARLRANQHDYPRPRNFHIF